MKEINKFYNADCLDLMKQIPDKSIDLVLTDPNYGVNIANTKEIGYKGFNTFEKKDWDKAIPEKIYFDEIFRVGKNQIIWGGNYFIEYLFNTRCFLIWDKGEGFYNRTYAECENAWTSFDANSRIFKHDPLANGDYHNKIHITQKPVKLFEWCLKNYSKENDLILDCFSGSGTTAIACHNLNRNFICIEKDFDYYNKSVERYQKHILQTRLEFN